jgi:AraC-like DNA-binding protein
MDVTTPPRHPPCVSVRGSSSSVQAGRDHGIDLLSQVLRELRLDSASFRSLLLRGEWRLRFDGPLRGVHIVVSGHPYLALDDGTARLLGPGDLVVLPRADAHTMSSAADVRRPAYSSLRLADASPEVETVFGSGDPETRIVCGVFFFADEDHPAVAGFPRYIHVPANAQEAAWLTGLTQALLAEVVERGPGSDVVMARLSDALVTRALRFHLETTEEPGWLHGLRDPAVSRALSALHRDLRRSWTIASLAQEAGLSRAAFAARFTALVGQSPMEYVFGSRMRRAETLLSSDRLTVAAVAAQVGYGSESALSAAFVRYSGTTPGAYRKLESHRSTRRTAMPRS